MRPISRPSEGHLIVGRGPHDEVEAHLENVFSADHLGVGVAECTSQCQLLFHVRILGNQVAPGCDRVLRRPRLRGASVACGGQRVVPPIVVPHECMQLLAGLNLGRITSEDLRPRVQLVAMREPKAPLHVSVAGQILDLREEGNVETRPMSLPQVGREVCTLNVAWKLLQDPQRSVRQGLIGHELVVVHDHPLVVDGAAVLFGKPLGPTSTVLGYAVGHDRASPRQHRLRSAHLLARREHGIGSLLHDESRGQHEQVVVGAQRAEVAREGGLACGSAAEWQVVQLRNPQHGEETCPCVVRREEL
mmetsp:Transcript_183570/g.582279  ORF Transcript_183570/g.582279 Transcript_183570/m.582279 type:complete len:304 (-) Transcript_183570:763-1674(-)